MGDGQTVLVHAVAVVAVRVSRAWVTRVRLDAEEPAGPRVSRLQVPVQPRVAPLMLELGAQQAHVFRRTQPRLILADELAIQRQRVALNRRGVAQVEAGNLVVRRPRRVVGAAQQRVAQRADAATLAAPLDQARRAQLQPWQRRGLQAQAEHPRVRDPQVVLDLAHEGVVAPRPQPCQPPALECFLRTSPQPDAGNGRAGVGPDQAAVLHDKMVNNLEQSKTLAQIRDTLLPKLMSGEIRVRVIGRKVEIKE